MLDRKKLTTWLNRAVLVENEQGRCRKIVLRHLIATEKANSIGEWIASAWTNNLVALADSIQEEAEQDVDSLIGLQTYVLRAYYGDETKPGPSRFLFRIESRQVESDTDLDPLGSEPANVKGMLSQQMRHNEAIMRLAIGTANQTLSTVLGMNRFLMERVESLERGRMAHVEATEQLLNQRNERELEAKRLEASEKRKDEAFQKLQLLVPVIINKVAGKKMLPEAGGGEMAQLQALLSSLSMEQMEKLSQVLTPVQMTSVLSFMEQMMKEQEAAAAKK